MPDVSINNSVDDHLSTARLPLVDISSYLDDNASLEARLATQKALDSACREFGELHKRMAYFQERPAYKTGFFYTCGHGLDTDYLRSLLQLGHKFFELPQQKKESIHISKSMDKVRGWQKVGPRPWWPAVNLADQYQIGENVTYAKRDQQEVHGRFL